VPDPKVLEMQKKREEAILRAKKVKLQSTMPSAKTPAVLIDGFMYNVGQAVANDWVITEIAAYEITLQWSGDQETSYTVSLLE